MGSQCSRPDRCQQRPCTDGVHHARQIVGEHAERHLARDLRQRLHQEVRRAHPHLERAEGMLNRLAPAAHGLGILIQPLLHGFDNVLVLPSQTPSRKVTRDVNEDARDQARSQMGTPELDRSRDKRKKVEMRFAHLRTHHRFERMHLRGLSGARDEFYLAAIARPVVQVHLVTRIHRDGWRRPS
jgi:Transposase DDE domain